LLANHNTTEPSPFGHYFKPPLPLFSFWGDNAHHQPSGWGEPAAGQSAVVSLAGILEALCQGDVLAVDGDAGRVVRKW